MKAQTYNARREHEKKVIREYQEMARRAFASAKSARLNRKLTYRDGPNNAQYFTTNAKHYARIAMRLKRQLARG